MLAFAPRLPYRLLLAIEELDDGRMPLMELTRRVGSEAERLGITRPSYERVRLLAHELRSISRRRGPTMQRVLIEGAMGLRSLENAKDAAYTPRHDRR